jgi:hypothetical protein
MSAVSYLEIVISNRGGTLRNLQNCIPHEAYGLIRYTDGTSTRVVGPEVLTALNIEITVFWDVTPCKFVDNH